MKRVLVDMHRLKHHPYNGLYTFSYNLGKSLSLLSPKKTELHFYLPKDQFGIFGNDALYEGHRSFDKFYKTGTSKFDIWHTTTTLSWYRPFNNKTKSIYTIHDLNFLLEEKDNADRNKRLLKQIQKRVDRADYIIGISEYALRVAQEHLNLGNTPKSVVYNGCNIPDTINFEAPMYTPAKPFLFAIGLVEPRKNFHLLPALLKDNEYELIIAGKQDAEYTQKIIGEINKWGVADRVKITGPISENDKHWYYKNCKAFLFPSYAEGFGLPIIEAMHFGKPVFTSTETCLPEIGGDAAWYFSSFDAESMQIAFANGMKDFATNNTVDRIKQRAAFFSWDKAAKQCLDIYNLL